MIKIERAGRLGWLAAGAAAMVVLMPTAAVAAGITFTGIEGTSKNKADVTAAGQLLTAPAAPASFFSADAGEQVSGATNNIAVAVPKAGHALVVTSLHADVLELVGSGDDEISYYIGANNPAQGLNCTNSFVQAVDYLIPATVGDTVLPYEPGLAVPAGDQLCAVVAAQGASDVFGVITTTYGDSVPSGDVPAAASRRVTRAQLDHPLTWP